MQPLPVIGALTLLMLGACDVFPERDTLRYRMTVEVETPQGLRTGSSVIETTIRVGKSWGDASGISYDLRGEAVAVDLAPGQTLLAILRGAKKKSADAAAYHADLLTDALYDGAVAQPAFDHNYAGDAHRPVWREQREEARRNKTSLTLPKSDYPMLVRFRDVRDAKTIAVVEPDSLSENFGPGVRLKRITVKVTDDPVATGLQNRLPSFGPESGYQEWLGKLEYSDPRRIGGWDFARRMRN